MDFSQYEDGKQYEVDGRNLFFFLQTYENKPANDTPEAHRTYVDIQYLVSGAEKVGVAPLEDMTEEVEARPDGDIWFYHGPPGRADSHRRPVHGLFPRRRPRPLHRPGTAPDLPQVRGQGPRLNHT